MKDRYGDGSPPWACYRCRRLRADSIERSYVYDFGHSGFSGKYCLPCFGALINDLWEKHSNPDFVVWEPDYHHKEITADE